jgi:hypothetical protein
VRPVVRIATQLFVGDCRARQIMGYMCTTLCLLVKLSYNNNKIKLADPVPQCIALHTSAA